MKVRPAASHRAVAGSTMACLTPQTSVTTAPGLMAAALSRRKARAASGGRARMTRSARASSSAPPALSTALRLRAFMRVTGSLSRP